MSSSIRSTDIDQRRERVLRRLQRMMELNADIDRNKSDSIAVQRGNEIKYIFDENIFEMFVRPYRHSEYVAAFSSGARLHDTEQSAARVAEAQSAMICSEYLFSGRLPGQRDRCIYMTEWHFWELRDQVEQRRAEIASQVDRNLVEKATSELYQEIAELRELVSEERLDDLLARVDPEVSADVKEHRGDRWPDDALCRFAFASQVARRLALDRSTEPAQQLDRVFSDEIAPCLRPLHLDYPVDRHGREQLARDTRMWMGLLLEEQDRRAARPGAENNEDRPRGSLATDARSLAYVLWIARSQVQSGARLVFVTGDRLVFDAYRRWHIGQARSEPFALRRPLQFAPFINFNDSPTDVENARVLFDRTREAVEVPLITFNLGLRPETDEVATGEPPLQAAAQREEMLLRLAEPGSLADQPSIGFFITRLDRGWLDNQESALRDLRGAWHQMERTAIGANYPLVSRRVDHVQRMQAELMTEIGATNIGDAVVTYVHRLLDRIVQSSIRVWFPLAVDFIRSPEWPSRRGARPRVPIAMRLSLIASTRAQQEPVEIDALLDAWANGDDRAGRMLDPRQNVLLAQRQHVVFAIAANLALRGSQWSQAERYADLASVAANLQPDLASDAGQRADAAECNYLKALAIRFRIGSFSPYGTAVTEDVWGRWLTTAVGILDACEAYHRDPPGERRHFLRELRAVSERAALRLFYATWVGAAEGDRLPAPVTPETGFRHLRTAFVELRRCAEIDVEVRRETLNTQRSAFFERLQMQYMANSAAAELLADLFKIKYDLHLNDVLVDETGPIMEQIEMWANPEPAAHIPTVARVDVSAFLVLRHRRKDALHWLQSLESDSAQAPALAIDRALLLAVNRILRTGTFA